MTFAVHYCAAEVLLPCLCFGILIASQECDVEDGVWE